MSENQTGNQPETAGESGRGIGTDEWVAQHE